MAYFKEHVRCIWLAVAIVTAPATRIPWHLNRKCTSHHYRFVFFRIAERIYPILMKLATPLRTCGFYCHQRAGRPKTCGHGTRFSVLQKLIGKAVPARKDKAVLD
jgi:hypothetical protein